MENNNDNYEYAGLKLMPSIFEKLVILLFDGKQFTRQAAISTVSKYHLSHGGTIEDNRDLVGVFKRATHNMQKREIGLVNRGYGTWELHYRVSDTTEIIDEPLPQNESVFKADEEFGKGENAVYMYYYDTYKKLASINGSKYWECKIGRTDRDPIQRVIGQAGTCYPELPHIAIIIHCDDSAKLENAIHGILKYKDRWIKNAPGTEWFLTSTQELKEIYELLSKEQLY